MNLTGLQDAVYSYVTKKPLFLVLMQFSKALIFIYPIYLILCRLSFLSPVTSFIGYISTILYFGYIIGLILCFAKREMLFISIALWIRAAIVLIDIFKYSLLASDIIGLAIYTLLGFLAFKSIYEGG